MTQGGAGPVEVDELDGLTISHWESHPRWWFNLRASNTEPLLRLNVEAADEDIMEKVRDDVLALVRDTTPAVAAAGVTGATGVSGADTAAGENR